MRETGIRVGDTITINDVQTALRKLWASGNYQDLEPRLIEQPEENHIVLAWRIKEQPYVSRIEFRGLDNVRASSVLDSAKLKAGGPLRPGRVAAAEGAVRDMLATKGIQLKSISHKLEPVPTSKTNEQVLIFDVVEGQRVAIAAVEFEGNQVLMTTS